MRLFKPKNVRITIQTNFQFDHFVLLNYCKNVYTSLVHRESKTELFYRIYFFTINN